MIKVKHDCRGMNTDEIFDTILTDRNIDIDFINPVVDDMLPLDSMENIDEAYKIVNDGLDNSQKFKVVMDTDTDGITAGTIMVRYLSDIGADVDWTINDGKAHGLLGQDITRFLGCDILIVVDSLDANCFMYRQIAEQGIKIIVLDHHIIGDIPYDNYVTLVSSQRNYGNPALSGAGVVWKFCKYIDGENLTEYADKYADLACAGIIADMCDMRSMENRYICNLGFNNIQNPFIKKVVGSFPFNSTAVSFSIATLVNSANRMNCNITAALAMLEDNPKTIQKYIKELKQCKEGQNDIVVDVMKTLIPQAEQQKDKKVIAVFTDTNADVAGLIGNKLLGIYKRPLMVLREKTIDNVEYYAGSIRAVGVDNFKQMCEDAGATVGGHELAAGIQIEKEKFENFLSTLNAVLADSTFDTETEIDIQIDADSVNQELINRIEALDKISGTGFKPISVMIDGVTDYEISNMSQGKHLVVKTENVTFIKWNWTGSFDEMEENAMMCTPLRFTGNLSAGFIGRTYMKKMIVDNVEVD